MSYRVDISALTTADLDEVAAQLAAGQPEDEVAEFVARRTAHNLATAAALAHIPSGRRVGGALFAFVGGDVPA